VTTITTDKDSSKAAPVSHRAQPPRGLALDVAQLNESEWLENQRALIRIMDELDAMDIPDSLPKGERDAFRAQRRAAFIAARDGSLMSGAMFRLNKAHIEMKTATKPVNAAIDDVKAAQKERKGAK